VKKWIITILVAVTLLALALVTHFWGAWVIKFAVDNDNTVDSLKKLIELLIAIGGLAVPIIKWMFEKTEKDSDRGLPATDSQADHDLDVAAGNIQSAGVSSRGNTSVSGDVVTGNKSVSIQGDAIYGDKKILRNGDLIEGDKYVVAGDFKVSITQQVVAQAATKQRKTWRDLSHLFIPMCAGVSESSHDVFISELVAGLDHTFRGRPYCQFTGMLRHAERDVHGQTVPVYYLLCHQIDFCESVRKTTELLLRSRRDARKQGPEALEQFKQQQQRVTDALNQEWNTRASFHLSTEWQPLEFTVDSARKLISIQPLPLSLDPSEFASGITSTSEVLRFLASLVNTHGVAYFGNATWYNDNYSLLKLWAGLMDHRKIDFDRLRINAEDYEEWDYVNPAVDLEIKDSAK
jgi:hypothetical protein